MKNYNCYSFDNEGFFKVYKKIWKAHTLTTKVIYKKSKKEKKVIVPNWYGFRKFIEAWYQAVPKQEKDNLLHFILRQKYNAEKSYEKMKHSNSIMLSGFIPVLIMFITLMVPFLWEKMESIELSKTNTLYINSYDYSNLNRTAIEALTQYQINLIFTENEKSFLLLDSSTISERDYDLLLQLFVENGVTISYTSFIFDKWIENYKENSIYSYLLLLILYLLVNVFGTRHAIEEYKKRIQFYNDILSIINEQDGESHKSNILLCSCTMCSYNDIS